MEILNERRNTHGDFDRGAYVEQQLKITMHFSENWDKLSCGQKTALEMLAHKMARILTGEPRLLDSWRDLVGYSQRGFESTEKLKGAFDVVVTVKRGTDE